MNTTSVGAGAALTFAALGSSSELSNGLCRKTSKTVMSLERPATWNVGAKRNWRARRVSRRSSLSLSDWAVALATTTILRSSILVTTPILIDGVRIVGIRMIAGIRMIMARCATSRKVTLRRSPGQRSAVERRRVKIRFLVHAIESIVFAVHNMYIIFTHISVPTSTTLMN